MIYKYGFSIAGKSHSKLNTPCQDAHCITQTENGWHIAAVADGVGSAKNSQIGSNIAVKTAVEVCKNLIPYDNAENSFKALLLTAFNKAFGNILAEAKKSKQPIESYDTTLSLVLYNGRRIVYAHSGDGAIIGLNAFGEYVEITEAQKSSDGICVVPLRAGCANWTIETYEEDLAAVILVTDGMLATLKPHLLRYDKERDSSFYIPLISYFADPFGVPKSKLEYQKTLKHIKKFIYSRDNFDKNIFYNRLLKIYEAYMPKTAPAIVKDIYKNQTPTTLMYSEQDDKTIVVMSNTSCTIEEKGDVFYSEPDWKALKHEWDKIAYPHMFADEANAKNTDDKKSDDSDTSENFEHVEKNTDEQAEIFDENRKNKLSHFKKLCFEIDNKIKLFNKPKHSCDKPE